MMIYVHEPARHRSPNLRSAESDLPPLSPGTSWARFGRETLLYNDDDEKYGIAAGRASRGARHPRRQVNVTREQLHVVVQHGRLFEQQHPDVPVLHDRGRFLLVQLDPAHARRLRSERETCYGVMPLEPDHVVFDERERVAARAPDPAVKALTDKLTRPAVEATVKKLASFGSRHATSAGYDAAARFADEQFKSMGYKTVAQEVAVGSGKTRNVIASKSPSGSAPGRIIIVSAHLDSINLEGGPSAPAPGADDNASGSAGVLEIARIVRDRQSRDELRFILFGGEELGLLGSRRYVASLSASERSTIAGVINMDMIGSLNSPSRGVLLEGAAVSQALIDGLSEAASTYTDLTIETSLHPFSSDHVPFIEKGVPAVLAIESSDNANHTIHSARDTVERIDYDLLTGILRMNMAFIAGSIS
jgi:hypothetical protein